MEDDFHNMRKQSQNEFQQLSEADAGMENYLKQIAIGVIVSLITAWVLSLITDWAFLPKLVVVLQVSFIFLMPLLLKIGLSRFTISVSRGGLTILSIFFIIGFAALFSMFPGGSISTIKMRPSSFQPKNSFSDLYPLRHRTASVHDYTNFEWQLVDTSITRPARLLPLASDSPCWAFLQGSLPACWLRFSWVGLFTHWVTETIFYRHAPISHRSGLTLARHLAC